MITKEQAIIQNQQQRIHELEDALEATQKDAERYAWLRDYHIGDQPDFINLSGGPGLDAAIDSALKAKG